MLRRLVEELSNPEAVASVPGLLADFGGDAELRRSIQDRFLPPAREYWVQILERAVARGEVREDADAAVTFHVLNGALFSRVVLAGEEADRDFLEGLARLVLEGLAPGGLRRA
jgi:hypothetical protein